MSKPNMYCGECPYWLAFGEPETTDEMNQAIEEHCAECDACDGRCFSCDYFDPYKGECSQEEHSEAQEYLDKMMRAARQQIVLHKAIHEEDEVSVINYDDTDGEIGDAEYESAAQEAHDELVHSLIEAGGEIRELRELLSRAYQQILLLGYDSGFTNQEIADLTNDIQEYFKGV